MRTFFQQVVPRFMAQPLCFSLPDFRGTRIMYFQSVMQQPTQFPKENIFLKAASPLLRKIFFFFSQSCV